MSSELLFGVRVENGHDDGLPEIVGIRVRCGCAQHRAIGCSASYAASPHAEPIEARILFEQQLKHRSWRLSRTAPPRWICARCAVECE